MDDLDRKLEAARERAEEYGNLRGLKETAEDYVKGVYAMLYEDAEGKHAPQRDAWVRRQPDYLRAVEEKANRYAQWTAAEIYMKLLFAQIDKYRTDSATNRQLDTRHT